MNLLRDQFILIRREIVDMCSDRGTPPYLKGLSGYSNAVAVTSNGQRTVTPDGQRAVSASKDQTLKLWDLASGRELRTLTGHRDEVRAVAVMSEGQGAISACTDNTVKIWNLEIGKVFATFTCDVAADCCAFSDALDLIVAGDIGGHVHFLHLEKPKPRN